MSDTRISGAIPFTAIGQGAQFKTFDMHNGRVLKVPLTEAETYLVAKRRRNIVHGTREEIAGLDVRVQTFMNSKARIPGMVNHRFKDVGVFHTHIGNPTIIRDQGALPEDTHYKKWGAGRVIYTQDKVEPLASYLQFLSNLPAITRRDVSQFERLISDYIEHIFILWDYGYSDYIFKLGDVGMTDKKSLITMDLGEFTSDRQFMERAVKERWWYDNIHPEKLDFPKMPVSLEPIFISMLDEALTIEALNQHWRSKHDCLDCSNNTDLISAFISDKVREIDYIDRL